MKYYRKSLKAIHRPDLEDEQVEGMCMQVKPDSRDILVGTIIYIDHQTKTVNSSQRFQTEINGKYLDKILKYGTSWRL